VEIGTLWIVLALVVALNALFIILRASLTNARLPQLVAASTQHPDRSLDPVLGLVRDIGARLGLRLVITVLHFLSGALVYLLLAAYFPGLILGWGLVGAGLAGIVLIALEVALESGVRRGPEKRLLSLLPLIKIVVGLLRPFSALMLAFTDPNTRNEFLPGGMTEDELRAWVEVGQPTGGLEKGERQMIASIFHFGDTLCREIMVPRIDILALEANTTVPEAVQALTLSGHSRVPVYEETIDSVIGLLYAKDLLHASLKDEEPGNIRPFLRPAYYVPEAKKVDELLREMQIHSIHMAIVVDEYGGMAGLVTLEDIVEEIVGEIRDEYDQGEELLYQQISEDECILSGRIGLDDLNEVLGTHLTTDNADTLGGYIYGMIGRVPVGGEHIQLEDWDLVVEQVTGRRIRKVHARRQTQEFKDETAREFSP
jgi:putative hemolysin